MDMIARKSLAWGEGMARGGFLFLRKTQPRRRLNLATRFVHMFTRYFYSPLSQRNELVDILPRIGVGSGYAKSIFYDIVVLFLLPLATSRCWWFRLDKNNLRRAGRVTLFGTPSYLPVATLAIGHAMTDSSQALASIGIQRHRIDVIRLCVGLGSVYDLAFPIQHRKQAKAKFLNHSVGGGYE